MGEKLMLSVEAIGEFKSLYFKEFGINLTDNQALDFGTKLIRLVKVMYGQDIPRKWVPKIDRDKKKGLG